MQGILRQIVSYFKFIDDVFYFICIDYFEYFLFGYYIFAINRATLN